LRHSFTLVDVFLILSWPVPPIFAPGGHDDAGVPSADVRTDPGQCSRPVRARAGHARLRPPARPVRTPARAAARRDRPRHPGRVRARGHAVGPVRRPADHAGRGPADGGRDACAGPGGQLPGSARRPARVRGRLRRAVDRRAVLAGRRSGRAAGPGRVGGQRRRGRRGRARRLRRAHRALRAGRPAAGRRRGLHRDHRRARRAPGPGGYRRVRPGCPGRAAGRDRGVIGAAAAVVTAGLSTGACALLVPAQLHLTGASSGQIGLVFAAAGILFAAGSALTTAAGRRAVTLPVICAGMLVLTAALSLGVLSTASLALIVMLCVATAARSVLWTVSYPLAATAAERRGIGLGAAVGLLNGIWAATAVLGPLGAGLAAEHLGSRTAFGLTETACAAALAVTVAAATGRTRLTARRAAGRGPVPAGHASRTA